MDVKLFLTVLRANTTGYTEIRRRPIGKTNMICEYFKTVDEAVNYINLHKKENDLWYGVSTRKPNVKKGTKDNCFELPAIWLDVDRADEEVKTEVIETLETLSLPKANLIIKSGHGYHFYWLIDPIVITQEILEKAEGVTKSLRAKISEKLNIKIDNCQNIDRILRIPETFNYKFPNKVVECQIDTVGGISPRDRYELNFLREKMGIMKESTNIVLPQPFKTNGVPADLKDIYISFDIFNLITRGEHSYSSRSEADQAIITCLVGAGLSNEQIKLIFDKYPTSGKYHDRNTKKEQYLAHSIASARNFTKPSLRRITETEERGFKVNSGYFSIDSVVNGFRSGNIYLIGGYQKCGKTSLCLSFVNSLLKNKTKVGYLDTELSNQEFRTAIVSNCYKISKTVMEATPEKIETWLDKYDTDLYHAGIEELLDKKAFIISFKLLLNKAKQFFNCGARIFFFDNLTTLGNKEEEGTGTFLLSNYLSRVAQFTKFHNVISFVIIHQKKDAPFTETPIGVKSLITDDDPERIFKETLSVVRKPTTSTIYGTGAALAQLSGSILVWRPYQLFDLSEKNKKGQIILENFRHCQGKSIRMDFDGESGVFEEAKIQERVNEITNLDLPF